MFKKLLCILFLLLLLTRPASSEGFTVKSISSSQVISNLESLSRANILVDIAIDGGGQSISGMIYPAEFGIMGSPFEFSVSPITEKLNYDILNQGTLWTYEYYYRDAPDFWNGAVCEPAPSYCFILPAPRIGLGNSRVLIIDRIPTGSYGAFQNPDISWSGVITLNINGTIYQSPIGSGETAGGQVQFPGLGNARWTGSMVTGRATPNQNLYVATRGLESLRWNIAPKTAYEVYVKSLTETDGHLVDWNKQMTSEAGRKPVSAVCKNLVCSDIINELETHNANLETMMSKRASIGYESVTATSRHYQSNNVVEVLDRTIAYPEIVLTLRADKLSIIIPVGIPKILDVKTQPFNAGDNDGYLNVQIQNAGNAPGTFAARTKGNPESSKTTLQVNETGMLTLHLTSGMNATAESFGGIVEVYDINSGANDSKSYHVDIIQPKLYIPNTTRTYNDVVTLSDEAGQTETNILDCSAGIFRFKDGEYECQEIETAQLKPAPHEHTPSRQIPLKIADPTPEYGWIAWLVILLIAAALVLSLINYFINTSHRTMRNAQKKGFAGMLVLILIIVIIYILWQMNLMDGIEKIMRELK